MIQAYKLPAGDRLEWEAPFGETTWYRPLGVWIAGGNQDGVNATRVVVSVKVDGVLLASIASPVVPASESFIFAFWFDVGQTVEWAEGTEPRGMIAGPVLPAVRGQKYTVVVESLTSANLSGRVFVNALGDWTPPSPDA